MSEKWYLSVSKDISATIHDPKYIPVLYYGFNDSINQIWVNARDLVTFNRDEIIEEYRECLKKIWGMSCDEKEEMFGTFGVTLGDVLVKSPSSFIELVKSYEARQPKRGEIWACKTDDTYKVVVLDPNYKFNGENRVKYFGNKGVFSKERFMSDFKNTGKVSEHVNAIEEFLKEVSEG